MLYFLLQDAHIGEEATTMLSRAKQFTEEKMGKAERTENDQAFDTLAKKTDKVKGYTEKLVKNTEAVLVPNPGKKNYIYSKLFNRSTCLYLIFKFWSV